MPAPDWWRSLGCAQPRERRAACERALALLRVDERTRTRLRAGLRDPSPWARFSACWVLFEADGPDARLVPVLLEGLGLPDRDARWQAAEMLVGVAAALPETTSALVRTASTATDPLRRRMALYALRELADPTAGDVFLRALDDPDPAVRRAALSCCSRLPSSGPALLERIVGIARSTGEPALRRLAVAALARLGPQHPEQREALLELLASLDDHPDRGLQRALARARSRLAPAPPSR